MAILSTFCATESSDCVSESLALQSPPMGMGTGASAKKALSWQSRPCPPDFDVVFVEQGRLECEAWYRARRTTITRWLNERGKARLIEKRAEFVKHQRSIKRSKGSQAIVARSIDSRQVDPKLVEIASRFLQSRAGGGWVVYLCECGNWMVGTHRRSPAQVIDMADRKGFDKRRALEQIRVFDEAI
jgi:hypothetical protein